ncbi:hypothetical protein [Actinomadura oligospora]|uniref:hypothetical protein n=1 Tax=Actinomadura oligospora TaxID=111804 RepID=UPI0004AE964F|nr:hypothetical protein [Actinomadura oligospora]
MTTTHTTATASVLTADERLTLMTAAHGVTGLMASADPGAVSSTKAGIAAGKALSSATGLVGHVLSAKPKGLHLGGRSTADLADQVLPALTRSMAVLREKAPDEVENFRLTIRTAVQAALESRRRGGGPARTAMAHKIEVALDAA